MEIRYAYGCDPPEHQANVSLETALSIFNELANSPLAEGVDCRASISFLDTARDTPRAFHLYFRGEHDRIDYELFDGTDEALYGLTAYADCEEAVRLYFAGESPLRFLKLHSIELYSNEH